MKMSHLPLDARAILHYLNDLGYRNITAEQLREFLKGMQPKSDKSVNKQHTPITTASTATKSKVTAKQVKVIKSKRPLCHFIFYLDICDHQQTKRIEEQIKTLGGQLEFFLTDSVTHFITDKTVLPPLIGQRNNNSNSITNNININNKRSSTPQTPVTPSTPQSPYTGQEYYDATIKSGTAPFCTARRTRQSRADAILNRARYQASNPAAFTPTKKSKTSSTTLDHIATKSGISDHGSVTTETIRKPPYKIWQTDQALVFFKRIHADLRNYLDASSYKKVNNNNKQIINLKDNFIKIETLKRNYRPYYHLFKKTESWPKIDLSGEDGAFRLQAKQDMTRKSRARSSQQNLHHISPDTITQPPLPTAVQTFKKPEDFASPICNQPKESTDKQCGVCEICKIEYDTLAVHLKTKDHEYFVKNSENFIALDTLIKTTADVNKFLTEESISHLEEPFVEHQEEMEVDASLCALDETVTDPLEYNSNVSNSADSLKQRPSPLLREKSKRTTKGKHSSEKFQFKTLLEKKSPTKPLSPQFKNLQNMVELQRMETVAVTPTTPRRRKASSIISPPIRAMLPPSSLYKVVETGESCTTSVRNRRGTGVGCITGPDLTASPSIIVKFQKVRHTELERLNGEAENFIYPKAKTSSELSTDIDRQTTSDNVRGNRSSMSIDSTSEFEILRKEHDNIRKSKTTPIATRQKRNAAMSEIKFPMGGWSSRQRFQNFPIQPDTQLKLISSSTNISPVALPEATRKSSRTATAIVTAATTSSRLLRAAVEAAKHKSRRQPNSKISASPKITTTSQSVSVTTTVSNRRNLASVGNLEDRMGNKAEKNISKKVEGGDKREFSEDEEDIQYNEVEDDDKDEDYIQYKPKKKRIRDISTIVCRSSTESREQRAARRLMRLSLNTTEDEEVQQTSKIHSKLTKSTATSIKKEKNPKKQCSSLPTKTKHQQNILPHIFDYTKSEHVSKLQYAFECLPAAELWYQVYKRQDVDEQRYYSYFHSTQYRKLPYELGPIPFDKTLNSIEVCNICQKKNDVNQPIITNIKIENSLNLQNGKKQQIDDPSTSGTTTAAYKHKKLHLLQRYQQEQLSLLSKKEDEVKINEPCPSASINLFVNTAIPKCDSKASTPELLEREFAQRREPNIIERERATSTHSNTSSSCGSSTASQSKKQYRNKHLNRVSELPPRKSPREHASTLALVSCIIRQRQDSSKNNSEIDEPSIIKTPSSIIQIKIESDSDMQTNLETKTRKETLKQNIHNKTPLVKPECNEHEKKSVINTSRCTRSAAATPIEELRFATEISETVKRMRRGQNKYDHSPPVIHNVVRGARCRRPAIAPLSSSTYCKRLVLSTKQELKGGSLLGKRKIHIKQNPPKQRRIWGNTSVCNGMSGSFVNGVRKIGTKKGVLEFEIDSTVLSKLDEARQYNNPNYEAWFIDKYLELAGKEYDETTLSDIDTSTNNITEVPAIMESYEAEGGTNTPPPTDYFTNNFDLYELLAGEKNNVAACEDDDQLVNRRDNLYFYSTTSLQNYYRKRKSLKLNRTGWPKAQKKKPQTKQQRLLEDKICFKKIGIDTKLKTDRIRIKNEPEEGEEQDCSAPIVELQIEKTKKVADNHEATAVGERGLITPPATDVDEHIDGVEDSIPEEDETMADSIEAEEENRYEAEIEATDADVEEEGEEDDDVEDGYAIFMAAYDHVVNDVQMDGQKSNPTEKKQLPTNNVEILSIVKNKAEEKVDQVQTDKTLKSLLTDKNSTLTASTPTTQMMRNNQRRTPLLNGSLGSCISPSEKAGDNSDIFTVSSDGLDTDLDLSNPHAHLKTDDEHYQQSHQCSHQTPKRKFDISKYAPNNSSKSSSCATEAATAAVKSLAISQFLKKQVRVNCRRLRAPFRRFRYRR